MAVTQHWFESGSESARLDLGGWRGGLGLVLLARFRLDGLIDG